MQAHRLTVETNKGCHIVTSSAANIKDVTITLGSGIADGVCGGGSATRMNLRMMNELSELAQSL